MGSNDQEPGVWNDDERTVLFLPSSSTAQESPADTGEEREAEARGEPEGNGQDAEIPFLWPGREQGQTPSTATASSVPVRTSPDEEPFDRPGATRVGLLG